MNKIVNIVNFIRAVEPRCPRDMFESVKREMETAKRYRLPTTWLLQYDALVSGPFVDYLKKEMPPDHEIGIWLEVVQQNVEAAGLEWRGRWSWDWHTNVGFTVGYTPRERERILDRLVARFAECFGRLPESVGSWLLDAHSLAYLLRRCPIRAACICKDQYGTDGYTLWGGYWANGYYPSRRNCYLPAQHEAGQLPVPVFRMLGSDPLYQYSAGIGGEVQRVITLEPACVCGDGGGGGDPAWCDWFFKENFSHPNLAMSYAQVGQENPFLWSEIRTGIEHQYRRLAAMAEAGTIRVETLSTTGNWFRTRFAVTPASAVVTLSDWRGTGHQGVWYMSRAGRLNLFRTEDCRLIVRDWHCFDETYAEPFLDSVCTENSCRVDALPILDGMLWHPAEIRFPGGPGEIAAVRELDAERLSVSWRNASGTTEIRLAPETLEIILPENGILTFAVGNAERRSRLTQMELTADGTLAFRHNRSRGYGIRAEHGRIESTTEGFGFCSENGVLRLKTFTGGSRSNAPNRCPGTVMD